MKASTTKNNSTKKLTSGKLEILEHTSHKKGPDKDYVLYEQ